MNDPFAEDLARKGLGSQPEAADPFAADLAWKASPQYARLKAKHDATMAKVAEINAQPDPFSPGQALGAVGHDLKERAAGLGRGIADVATHPIATFVDDARRRQFERGIDDAVTLGYGKRAADWLTSKLPESLQHGTSGDQPASLAETEAADTAAAPDTRAGGQIAGMFMPGASSLIGKGAGKLMSSGTGQLAVNSPLLRAAGSYMTAAPAAAALQSGPQTVGERLVAAAQAAMDPTGLAMAVGATAAGRSLGNKIKNSKGGQARQLIEREGQGAQVGLATPGSGGVFDRELAGLPANDRGIGAAAEKGARAIDAGLKDEFQQNVAQPYKGVKAVADQQSAGMPHRDVTPVMDLMQRAVNSLGTDDAVVGKLERKIKQLESHRATPDDPVMVPESDLNDLRRSLMRMAKVGASDVAGEKEAPLRAAAFMVKDMVDQGPYADANAFYSEGKQNQATARKQLGLKAKPSANNEQDIRKIKLGLEREVQNTKTAGGDTKLDEFRAAHPDLALQTKLAQLQNAKADLSFRMGPQHGGLLARVGGGLLGPAGAVIAQAAGHGTAGLAGAAGYLAAQNAGPIAGRVLYPLTRPANINPLVWARMQQTRRDEELAKLLKGETP